MTEEITNIAAELIATTNNKEHNMNSELDFFDEVKISDLLPSYSDAISISIAGHNIEWTGSILILDGKEYSPYEVSGMYFIENDGICFYDPVDERVFAVVGWWDDFVTSVEVMMEDYHLVTDGLRVYYKTRVNGTEKEFEYYSSYHGFEPVTPENIVVSCVLDEHLNFILTTTDTNTIVVGKRPAEHTHSRYAYWVKRELALVEYGRLLNFNGCIVGSEYSYCQGYGWSREYPVFDMDMNCYEVCGMEPRAEEIICSE